MKIRMALLETIGEWTICEPYYRQPLQNEKPPKRKLPNYAVLDQHGRTAETFTRIDGARNWCKKHCVSLVFREDIRWNDTAYGSVGFAGNKQQPTIRIVSWTDCDREGHAESVEFPLEAVPALMAMLATALAFRSNDTDGDGPPVFPEVYHHKAKKRMEP